jgi:DNA invertase Pin-like site-specific DNA recombinase
MNKLNGVKELIFMIDLPPDLNDRRIYAYLRVSTDLQDINSQKMGLLDFCNRNGYSNVTFVEEIASGKVDWKERSLGELIHSGRLRKGDIIVFPEISRIARVLLQILEVLKRLAEIGVIVRSVKENLTLDNSLQGTIVTTLFGLAAEIERQLISARTKEGMSRARANGKTIGRPRHAVKHLHHILDPHHAQIIELLKKELPVTSIAKIFGVTPASVHNFIRWRNIREKEDLPEKTTNKGGRREGAGAKKGVKHRKHKKPAAK